MFSLSGNLCRPSAISQIELDTTVYKDIWTKSSVLRILGITQSVEEEKPPEACYAQRFLSELSPTQLANHIRELTQNDKNELFRELGFAEGSDEPDEFDPDETDVSRVFPSIGAPNDKDRFRQVIRVRYQNAPFVRYEYLYRRIRTSRSDDRSYIRTHYQGFCQMCEQQVRAWQVAEIFLKPIRELAQLNLGLCRNCAATYQELRRNEQLMNNFAEAIRSRTENDGEIRIKLSNHTIRFTAMHLAEIQEILKLQDTDSVL